MAASVSILLPVSWNQQVVAHQSCVFDLLPGALILRPITVHKRLAIPLHDLAAAGAADRPGTTCGSGPGAVLQLLPLDPPLPLF